MLERSGSPSPRCGTGCGDEAGQGDERDGGTQQKTTGQTSASDHESTTPDRASTAAPAALRRRSQDIHACLSPHLHLVLKILALFRQQQPHADAGSDSQH